MGTEGKTEVGSEAYRVSTNRRVALGFGIGVGILVVIVAGVVIRAWIEHNATLYPKLILELPASECEHLTFGASGTHWDFGRDVDDLCKKYGVTPEDPVFAIRGEKVLRFNLDGCGYHGDLERIPADENTVYFYSYHSGFTGGIIMAP
jgi:hypothetical protein